MRDPRLVAADEAVASNARIIVGGQLASVAIAAVVIVAPETIPAIAKKAVEMSKKESVRLVICGILACKGVDPAKPLDTAGQVKRGPEGQIADDLKGLAETRSRMQERLRKDPSEQTPPPPPPPPPRTGSFPN